MLANALMHLMLANLLMHLTVELRMHVPLSCS
jgi:hypothetical protein